MKIKSLKLNNFRGIDEVSISFVNDLISVVGRNDVGKSTVIKAMETFFSKRSFEISDFPFKSPEGTRSEVELHFTTNNKELKEYSMGSNLIIRHTYEKKPSKATKLIECLKEFKVPSDDDLSGYANLKIVGTSLDVEFPKSKPKNEKEIEDLTKTVFQKIDELKGTKIWVDITKHWSEITPHLPEIILIPAVQDPENEQKMTSDSSAFGSLFRVGLRKLLQYDEEGKEAVSILESKMGKMNDDILHIVAENLKTQGNPIKLTQQPSPLDVAKSFSFQMDVEDEYGVRTPLSQRGNGVQRSVLMAIIRAQSEITQKIKQIEKKSQGIVNDLTEDTDRYLYLIEEPEAFLHLSAQRDLYYSIKELISYGSQALITTHSTLFMDEGDIDQVVLLHREEGKTSASQAIEIDEIKENIGEIVQVSQLMTGKVCCLVEGVADVNAFKVWVDKLGYSFKELGIYFIDMKGCNNAEYYANVKVIKDFNVKLIVVLDTDFHSSNRAATIKQTLVNEHKLKDHQVVILKNGEIENYFPISKVESVLGLAEGSIDVESYQQDPKEALINAKSISGDRAKKYKENRDSLKIAKAMEKIEIDEEIIDVIHRLVKSAGGEILEEKIAEIRG